MKMEGKKKEKKIKKGLSPTAFDFNWSEMFKEIKNPGVGEKPT